MRDEVGSDEAVTDDRLLAEQVRYYDERAPIYEQLSFLQGRYEVADPVVAESWHRETARLERFTQDLDATGSVLELACGNGLWTRLFAPRAGHLAARRRLVAHDRAQSRMGRRRSRPLRAG